MNKNCGITPSHLAELAAKEKHCLAIITSPYFSHRTNKIEGLFWTIKVNGGLAMTQKRKEPLEKFCLRVAIENKYLSANFTK